jgi:hypothetical protein
MCLLLAPCFFSFFLLLWPLPVLKKQTRQAACTIEQSILLRCLWFQIILCLVHRHKTEVDSRSFRQTRQPTNVFSKPPTTNLINIGISSIWQVDSATFATLKFCAIGFFSNRVTDKKSS